MVLDLMRNLVRRLLSISDCSRQSDTLYEDRSSTSPTRTVGTDPEPSF